jgi:hypothetical protein
MQRTIGIAMSALALDLASAAFSQTASSQAASDPAPPASAQASPQAARSAEPPPRVGWVVRANPPIFRDETPSTVAAGSFLPLTPLTGDTTQKAGAKLRQQYGLEDPVRWLGPQIAKDFAEWRGGVFVSEPIVVADGQKTIDVAAAAGLRYVVDAPTAYWTVEYSRAHWSRYSVNYGGYLWISDVKLRRPLTNTSCDSGGPPDTPDSPSHERLLADNAALLKSLTLDAARTCYEKYRAALLKNGFGPRRPEAPAPAKPAARDVRDPPAR